MAVRIGYLPEGIGPTCEINNLTDVQRCGTSQASMLDHIKCIFPESVQFLPFHQRDYDAERATETVYGGLKSNIIDAYLQEYRPLSSDLHNYATYGAVFADTPACFYNQRWRVRETKNLFSFAEPLTSVNFNFLILHFVFWFVLKRVMERATRKLDCPIITWTSVSSALGHEFHIAFILCVYSSLIKAHYPNRVLTAKKFTTAIELANKIIKGELTFVQTDDIPGLKWYFEIFFSKADADILIVALNQSKNVVLTDFKSACQLMQDDDRIVLPAARLKMLKHCPNFSELIDEICIPSTPAVMMGTLFSKRSTWAIENHSRCVQYLNCINQKKTLAARQDQIRFSRDPVDAEVVAVPVEYVAIPIAIWSFGTIAAGICLALENYAKCKIDKGGMVEPSGTPKLFTTPQKFDTGRNSTASQSYS